MRAYKKYIFALLLLIVLVGFGLFQISRSRTFQFFGGLTSHVDTDEKIVALTFDDAPTEYSDAVLQILDEKGVKATFYLIGENIEKYPEQAKNIVEHGHEVGNHSYSHARFLIKSPSFVEQEIQTTNSLIKNLGYEGQITFRPPYGKKLFTLPWYLSKHNIKTITWNVEPDTYARNFQGEQKTEFLVSYVLENTQPGSIILLHPFCKTCQSERESIAKIIDGLHAKGFQFVTVSQLLLLE